MGGVVQDLKFSFRMLARSRNLTAAAVITIALAIGANTSIYTIVNAVLLRPLPYKNSERVVSIGSEWINFQHSSVSVPEYLDYASQSTAFESMAAYSETNVNISRSSFDSERVRAARVTAPLFQTLGVTAFAGNLFSDDDNKTPENRKVVLTHRLWERYFGNDPRVVGTRLKIDHEFYTVVGITPERFSFPGPDTEIFLPLYISPNANRGAHNRKVIALLKSDSSLHAARDEMRVIAKRLQRQYPEHYPANSGWDVSVIPLKELLTGEVATGLRFLFLAVGLVLVIACANVANLLLVKSASRIKEVAIRRALGAGKFGIARQMMMESLLIAVAGGFLGLLLASAIIQYLPQIHLSYLPRLQEITIDFQMLAYSAVISILAGAVFGIFPAMGMVRDIRNDSLHEITRTIDTRGSGYLKHAISTLEIALATIVLSSAAILAISFLHLTRIHPGFQTNGVVTSRISLSTGKYRSGTDSMRFYLELLDRLRHLPQVQSAGAISHLPLGGEDTDLAFAVEGYISPVPGLEAYEQERIVSSQFFQTMRIPILIGREFNEDDTSDKPGVAIVSESLAKKYLAGKDPLGKRIRPGGKDSRFPWITIVGVCGDVKHSGLDRDIKPTVYFPMTQKPDPQMTIVVRSSLDESSAVGIVARSVRSIDAEQPVYQNQSMEQYVRESTAQLRLNLGILVSFAVLATALACFGIYAVISFSVSRRIREFGIRMAVGANSRNLLTLALGEASRVIAIGLLSGMAASVAARRFLSTLVFGIRPDNLQVLLCVSIILGVLALAACLIPAIRASHIEPVQALKSSI